MSDIEDDENDEDEDEEVEHDDAEADDDIGVEKSASNLVPAVGVSNRRREPESISLASARASRNTKPPGSL